MKEIYKRRSIRSYSDKPLPEGIIEKIIAAGMQAPSAGNEQPWQFIVITDKKILNKIPEVHPYSKMVTEAQAAILLCGDLSLEKHDKFWVQDCSAATENMLLAIAHHDLGSVWLGVYPREDRVKGMQVIFNLPEHIIPFSLLPVAYPAHTPEEKDYFKKERIHYNAW